jgi:hypothetical protein
MSIIWPMNWNSPSHSRSARSAIAVLGTIGVVIFGGFRFCGKSRVNRSVVGKAESLVAAVRDYVVSARALVNNIGIPVPEVADGPFDWICLAHLSKVFALADSCLILLKKKHPDEAFGLSRTIVECAANLRYLTQDPVERATRTQLFVEYAEKERRYWLEQIRVHVEDPGMREDAERFAEVKEVEKRGHKPLAALGHWSGLSNFVWKATGMDHPLDGDTNPLSLRKKSYAAEYHSTSHYVHCSEWGLRNYHPVAGQAYSLRDSSGEYDETASKLLHLIVVHLHESIRYALSGIGISPPNGLQEMFTELVPRFADQDMS